MTDPIKALADAAREAVAVLFVQSPGTAWDVAETVRNALAAYDAAQANPAPSEADRFCWSDRLSAQFAAIAHFVEAGESDTAIDECRKGERLVAEFFAAQATPASDMRGLHHKFYVRRMDGSSCEGGKHFGCEYFVLDMTHDQYARAAVLAYAAAAEKDRPQLAADLRAKFCYAPPPAQATTASEECHLCSLPMRDGTDGHGLGECVPICPTCDGSGTAQATPASDEEIEAWQKKATECGLCYGCFVVHPDDIDEAVRLMRRGRK